jgi:hypothetical protein
MAIPLTQYPIYSQGVLTAGTNTLFTGPAGYNTTISGLTFTSSAANVVTLVINKVTPVSSVTSFSFTLDPGDVLCDNTSYILQVGDTIEVTTTAASTNYMFSGQAASATVQYTSFI